MGIQYLLNRVLRRAIGCGLLIGAFYHGQVTSLQGAEPVDNWAEYPRPEGVSGLVSIAYGNNLFVAAGTNGTIVSSTNGMDWIKVDAGMSGGPGRVRFVDDRFFVSGFAPGPIMSSNGTDWSPVGVFYNDITFANGAYYTVLWTQVGRSTNLTDWTHFTAPSGFRNIAYGNGAFVANGGESFSYVHYSTDGEQWLQVESSSDPE